MQFIKCLLTVCLLVYGFTSFAQQTDNAWTLERCIKYAIDHNISIRQDSLNTRLARYTVKESQLSQLPNVSAQGTYGRSFGRSINPATNQFVEGDYNSLTASATANALVFSGMQVRNTIAKNKYSLEAALADLDQLRDDISLNVANSYLAVLLAREQIDISKNQVLVSQAQLDQTRAFADAGRLPELNVAQLESQVATDSSNLINSIATYNSAILDLKTLLNLDFDVPFNVKEPDVEPAGQLEVMQMQPGDIYQKAHSHFGSIKGSEMRVNSAEKGLLAAKGALYPQLYLGYQPGTNFASNYAIANYPANPQFYQFSGFRDSLNHTTYYAYQAIPTGSSQIPFGSQLNDNLRHMLYVNLNIPIFNGWQSQYNIRQAKINLATQQLNEYNAELTLKQNVFKAHNNAVNSIQKYNAAKRAEDAAARAFEFAKKRYDLGLTSTVDLLVTQNSQFAAASNLVIAKYDLVFKLKVIDYYLGKELKL